MADEQWKRSNLIFGSAGMASSGMMPQNPLKPEVEPEPENDEPEVVADVEEEEAVAPLPTNSIRSEILETEAPLEPEVSVEVEPVPQYGYGINSKAQGLFSDLGAGIIADGERRVDDTDWDTVFSGIDGVIVEGVSDADEGNLGLLKNVFGSAKGYGDYREMLARTKPNLAVVPQVGNGRRYEIIKNCLMSGCHVICPPPFTRDLEEADELTALADRRGLKICVAFPMRLDPNVVRFHESRANLIGDLVEIRAFGQLGEGCGGEDLLLRGGPLFDLARWFAGEPSWCHANITTNGRKSLPEDVVNDPESPFGALVGDRINAQFFTENGVTVNFISHPGMGAASPGWGMEFIGSENVMRLYAGPQPVLSVLENPGQRSAHCEERWVPWPGDRDPYHPVVDDLVGSDAANRLVVADWLDGINSDREALSGPRDATKSLEMVHAVFRSGMSGKKVYFPVAKRHHPLGAELLHGLDFRKSA